LLRASDIQAFMRPLWKIIELWLDSYSRLLTFVLIVAAFGGAVLLSQVTHVFDEVTGPWLLVEGIGWFELFLCSFLIVKKKDDAVRAAEITGTITYAVVLNPNPADTTHQRILIKLNIRNQTKVDKNIKNFTLLVQKGGAEYSGERQALQRGLIVAMPLDRNKPWTYTHQDQPTDIENKMAKDDAVVLSGECTGWLQFHVPGVFLVREELIGVILTVTEESGYKYQVRDSLVTLH
jgi:hypothetical protein